MLGNQNTVEKYHAIRANAAILGIPYPIMFGQNRISTRLIDYNDFSINKAKQQGGKGLGKGGTQYVYSASIIGLLTQPPIGEPVSALLNVWDSTGRFVLLSTSESYTIAGGGGSYTPTNASIFGNDQGVYQSQAYSVGPFTDYGSPGPVTLTGNQNVPFMQVPSSPGTGQYSVNSTTGVYTFAAADAGKTVVVNYSFYRYQIITEERTIVPFTGPYTITVDNSANYKADKGVAYFPSGTALTQVGGSPAVGQYSHSGATYTFNSGDSGQPIVISYTYNDPNTDTNAPTTINLTLVGGSVGQAPTSYMLGKHPSKALGYSGASYIFSSGVYFGYTSEMPQYSYELACAFQFGAGIVDAILADCIEAMLTDPGLGCGFPSQYLGDLTAANACWTANGYFISPIIENQSPCAQIVGQWLEAGMVAEFWSEGKLKFVPYSDTTAVGNGVTYSPNTTPIDTVTDDVYVIAINEKTNKAKDPLESKRSPYQDASNRATVAYLNRANDYNPEPIYEQDEASILRFGRQFGDTQQWDFITTLTAAQYSASMKIQRDTYIRNEHSFMVSDAYSYWEPMDVVVISDPVLLPSPTPVRLTKVEDNFRGGLSVTAEDFIWGAAQPAFNPKTLNSPNINELAQQDPGNTNALVFEGPNRYANFAGLTLYGFANGSNPNWGGCHIWVSYDGTKYELMDTVFAPGNLGVLTQNLAAFSGTNPDTTDTLQVKLNVAGDTLSSTTSAGAAAGITNCAVVNASNVVEILSYQNSSLVGSELYNLTTLYRGTFGTSGISHVAGEIFAELSQASFVEQYDPIYIGSTIYFKFTSFNLMGNQEQPLPSVTAYPFVLAGVGKGAVALDTGYLLIGAPGYTAYRPLSNPLTGHDAGSNATVFIVAFTIQIAGLTNINYNSGSITGLSYNTLYYIYFDDIAEVGGTVSYQATTTKEVAFQGTNRFFVGSIRTPLQGAPDTIGNNDGGTGAQSGVATVIQFGGAGSSVVGNGTVSGTSNAQTPDCVSAFATLSVTANSLSNLAQINYTPPSSPTTQRFSKMTFYVALAVTQNTINAGATAPITATVNIATGPSPGAYFVLTINPGLTPGLQIYSLDLPYYVNPLDVTADVSVETSNIATSGVATVHLYNAWLVGQS